MPSAQVRVEMVLHDGQGWHYHLVVQWEDGQARGVLSYSSEPSHGKLETDIKAWYKSLVHGSPPQVFNMPAAGGP